MIDIDQTIKNLDVISRKNLFEQLLNTSAPDLKALKEEVKARKKIGRLIKDESFKPKGSTHDAFVAMISTALLQKSSWQSLNNVIFPIKKIVLWFIGFTLKKHPYLGVCYKRRNRKRLNFIKRFWLSHWKWIIGVTVPSILTIIGLYIAYLALIKAKL